MPLLLSRTCSAGQATLNEDTVLSSPYEKFDRACGETQFSGSIFGARAQSHESELSQPIQMHALYAASVAVIAIRTDLPHRLHQSVPI